MCTVLQPVSFENLYNQKDEENPMMTSCTDPIFSFQSVNRDHSCYLPRAVNSDLGIFRGYYPDIDDVDAYLECPDFSSLLLNEENVNQAIENPFNGQYSDDMSSSEDTVGISSSDDNISDDNSLTDAVIEMISEKGAPPAYEPPKLHYSFTSTSSNTLPKTTPSNKLNFSQTKMPQNIHDNSSKKEDKKINTEINVKQESIRKTETTDENKRGRPSRDHRSCKSVYSGANFDTKPKKVHKPRVKKTIHLWEFLEEIVDNKDYSPKYITWVSRDAGVFRLVDSKAVAKLWGQRKNRHDMTYEKMSRAIRYYYERGIIRHVMGQKLIYQFGDEINEKRKDKTQTKTLDENDQVSS